MSIYKTLILYQGTDFFPTQINLINTEIDANTTLVSRMAQSFYSEEYIELSATTGTSNNYVQLSLDSTETTTISPGKYVFEVISINDSVTRLIDGIIEVVPGIGLATDTYT